MLVGIANEIDRIGNAAGPGEGPAWTKTIEAVGRIRDEFQSIRDGKKTPPEVRHGWIVGNRFVDEMSANFMAAILRGCVSVTLYRGNALARFWSEMFHWQECDNLAGYGPDRTWQAAGASGPVVLFNACNVGQGSRLVIGFPPLPIDVFPRPKTADDKSSSEPAEQLTRSPPAELFHLYSGLDGSQFHPRISLTKAVRLSSNFPWGFYSSVIQDPSNPRSASYTPSATYVLDGGVVDNTGIDAIHDLFDGLRQTTSGHRLLNLLARRRVVLLEIDSGAKPSRRSPLQGIFPGLLEPAECKRWATPPTQTLTARNGFIWNT